MKTLILALAAVVASAQGQTPQNGSRGGCYVIVTGKNGKTYRKYVDKALCRKAGKDGKK